MCIHWLHQRNDRESRLVVKAGLIDQTDDDRATHYGAFLTVAAKLCREGREQTLVFWKRKGKRAVDYA